MCEKTTPAATSEKTRSSLKNDESMRVLIVTYNYLFGFGGGAYGARAYINAFAALYDDVTLLYPARVAGDPLPEIDPRIRRIEVVDRASKPAKAARLVLRGVLHRFERPFKDLLSRERFDLIVFQNSKCSSRLMGLAHASGARTIVQHDNFEWEYTRDNTPLLLRPFLLPAVVKTEREAVREADVNLVLTPDDGRLLTNRYGRGKDVRMELLYTFEYRPVEDCLPSTVEEPVFAITGNLGARQTRDSLIPWLKVYYPLLKREVPQASLIVAGKDAGDDLKRLLSEMGIELVDTPPDMSVVPNRARYYICPVDCGGGVKLRVMDGLRTGMPALVHRVSARGYEALEGLSVFAYDGPETFVEALRTLMSCPGSAEQRQRAYRSRFSFESGVERLRSLLEKA